MKISDSLGNLYTHTMFKKKAYEMPAMAKNQNQEDSDEITGLEFVFEMFCPPKTEVRRLFFKFCTANILFWEHLGVVCFRPKNLSFL